MKLTTLVTKTPKATVGRLLMEKAREWEKICGSYKVRKVNLSNNHGRYLYR